MEDITVPVGQVIEKSTPDPPTTSQTVGLVLQEETEVDEYDLVG